MGGNGGDARGGREERTAVGNGTNCRMDRRTYRPGFNRGMLFCTEKSFKFHNIYKCVFWKQINVYWTVCLYSNFFQVYIPGSTDSEGQRESNPVGI